jgi:AraC-like DNA-binding protein
VRAGSGRFGDVARYWRSPLLPGGELLTAEFYGQRFAPHWHDGFVVPIIEAGAQGYRYRGGHRVAPPGTIAAINPGELHTGERASARGWAYRVFYPAAEWMQRLAAELVGGPADVPGFAADAIVDPLVAGRLLRAHRLLEAESSGAAEPLAAESALQRAMALLLTRHSRTRVRLEVPALEHAVVAAMKERLAGDVTEPITLSELAAAVGLSPCHACRVFSRGAGLPPHAWRNQLRVARAADLLRRGLSVTETAAALGFADQSHFTRLFRRSYGVPPGRWRADRSMGGGEGRLTR